MKKLLKSALVALFVVLAAVCMTFASSAADGENGKWISAWGTAPTQIGLKGYENITAFVGRVMTRSVITPTASGTKVRIRFSNHYGTSPLTISRAAVARSTGGSAVDDSTGKLLYFNGKIHVTIPAGEEVISDPVDFNVNALEDIAVSLFVDRFSEIKTMGLSGSRTYLSIAKDADVLSSQMGLNSIIDDPVRQIIRAVLGRDLDLQLSYSFIKVTPCIATVDVYSDKDAYSVAVVGDSTVSNEYPQYLAEQINKQTDGQVTNVGVVGKGIIGNRLGGEGLGYGAYIFGDSMIDRLDRDVLSLSGLKYVIVKIGANDIMHPVCTDIQKQYPGITQPTAEELIESFKTAFNKLHSKDGVKVIAIGITQWKGNDRDYLGTGAKYVRTDEEFRHDWQIALDVNEWLETTASKEGYHDGYVSYNEKSADPNDPEAFLPAYTIDGAHPSDELQHFWAEWFPLSLIGVSKRVGAVRLDHDRIVMNIGESEKIKASIIPADAPDQTVIWKSTDEKVAIVNNDGVVTGVGNGKCEIICTSVDGNRTAKCLVTVNVPVTGVEMKTATAEVYNTRTVKLSATVYPADATNKKLTWSSSDKKIATVSSKGVVTGVGSGTANIICKTVDGGFTSICTVTVKRKVEVESIVLSATSKNIWLSDTYILSASVLPSNATFKDVKFKSSNTKVATVTSDGVVYAVAPGTANITVTAADNSFISKICKVNVRVKTTGVKLNKSSMTVYIGRQRTLVPTVFPLNASDKSVKWKSSDSKIASVNSDGTVTGKKAGTVTVTCTTNTGKYVASCKVKVEKYINTKSVSLNKLTVKVYAGRKYTLVATVLPENASSKKLKWKSSNTKVAKVDSNGVVTGVSKGTAIITCTTKDTGKKATCSVTVKNIVPSKVYLNKSKLSLYVNETEKLKTSIVPSDATVQKVTWKSSNTKVATVSSSGKVKAVAPGKATITCTTQSGSRVAKCVVTVTRPKIKSVTFKKQNVELSLNNSYTLKPTVKPSGAKGAKLKWESSNTKVVKVDSNGKITAVGVGSAIVTCTPADKGGGTGSLVVVTVKKNPVIGVKLNQTNVITTVGKSFKLKASVLPSNASIKTVKWSTSNKKVATVSKSGVVKAVGKGVCEIRVVTTDGNAIAICTVRVR